MDDNSLFSNKELEKSGKIRELGLNNQTEGTIIMTYVSKNWKTLITLLVAVVLYVAWSTSPALASAYDPMTPRPWVSESEAPRGDEGGWNDPTSIGGNSGNWISGDLIVYSPMRYFILYFIPKKVEFRDTLGKDDLAGKPYTDKGRGSSSQ
jgi:hypothetical protein